MELILVSWAKTVTFDIAGFGNIVVEKCGSGEVVLHPGFKVTLYCSL